MSRLELDLFKDRRFAWQHALRNQGVAIIAWGHARNAR